MKESLKLHSIEIEDPTPMKEVIKQDIVVKKLPILWFSALIAAILSSLYSIVNLLLTNFDFPVICL